MHGMKLSSQSYMNSFNEQSQKYGYNFPKTEQNETAFNFLRKRYALLLVKGYEEVVLKTTIPEKNSRGWFANLSMAPRKLRKMEKLNSVAPNNAILYYLLSCPFQQIKDVLIIQWASWYYMRYMIIQLFSTYHTSGNYNTVLVFKFTSIEPIFQKFQYNVNTKMIVLYA